MELITANISSTLFPGLAYDGTLTFAGVLQSYFTIRDATGQNVGISRPWADETATQYLRDYTERLLPTMNKLFGNQKPMHSYLEQDFLDVLSELAQEHNYADSTTGHYRKLLWDVYKMGVKQNHYPDTIYWDELEDEEEDPEKKEQHRARTLTRNRKSLGIPEELRMLRWFCSLNPKTAKGEEIGLALMFFEGVRDNEACGASFGDFRMMKNHPDMAVFVIGNTTKLNSNVKKPGGKTENAPRQLPLFMAIYRFLEKRKAWIQEEIDAGRLILPEGIHSVDELSPVCRGTNVLCGASTVNLSVAARQLFEKIGISKSEIGMLHKILLSTEFRDTELVERNPTAYLLRRNVATRQYTLGFEWENIQYWIAHSIESVMVKRTFFADEERLYAVGKAYEHHPLFEILSDMLGENAQQMQEISKESCTLEEKATYLVDIEANEPNTPIRVTVTSDKPFSIKRVDKDLRNPPAKEVSMLQKLRKAYWEKYRSGQW